MLDAVFNELSVRPAPGQVEACQVIDTFVVALQALRKHAGAFALRIHEGFYREELAPGYSLGRWMRDENLRQQRVDVRERQQFLKSLATKHPVIEDADDSAVIQTWRDRSTGTEVTCDGAACEGLFAAYLLHGMAVSLPTELRWDCDLVAVQMGELGSEGDLVARGLSVPHVSRSSHCDAHASWIATHAGDPARAALRQRVPLDQCQHVLASEYAKHVSGISDAERRTAAESPGGAGQFRYKSDAGEQVTDALIKAWERDGLRRALDGEEGCVARHGDGFHVFITFPFVVGFHGGTGLETDQLRIEWSNGDVHSHPRA